MIWKFMGWLNSCYQLYSISSNLNTHYGPRPLRSLEKPGTRKFNGALVTFHLRAHEIGDFLMDFCAGTLDNLLSSFENSHTEGPWQRCQPRAPEALFAGCVLFLE